MFWDNVAWLYDIFADGINRKANRALCAAVGELISPADDVLECACGTAHHRHRTPLQAPDRHGFFCSDAAPGKEKVRQIRQCAACAG